MSFVPRGADEKETAEPATPTRTILTNITTHSRPDRGWESFITSATRSCSRGRSALVTDLDRVREGVLDQAHGLEEMVAGGL